MKRYLKKLTAFTLAALMAFFCFISYQQVDADSNNAGDFNVTYTETGESAASGWTYTTGAPNTITISSNGAYTITGDDSVHSDYQIVISDGITVELTINNVKISNSSGAAMSIDGSAKVTLVLEGDNVFDSSSASDHAGIEFNDAAENSGSLTITAIDDSYSLTATGNGCGAGIGGGDEHNGSNIAISGGTIIADGTTYKATWNGQTFTVTKVVNTSSSSSSTNKGNTTTPSTDTDTGTDTDTSSSSDTSTTTDDITVIIVDTSTGGTACKKM